MPQELSRAELASLEELAKEWGAKGLAYLVFDEEGEVRSPIAKFLSRRAARGGPAREPATTVLFGADEPRRSRACSGASASISAASSA